jgi:hypothetical protein
MPVYKIVSADESMPRVARFGADGNADISTTVIVVDAVSIADVVSV